MFVLVHTITRRWRSIHRGGRKRGKFDNNIVHFVATSFQNDPSVVLPIGNCDVGNGTVIRKHMKSYRIFTFDQSFLTFPNNCYGVIVQTVSARVISRAQINGASRPHVMHA